MKVVSYTRTTTCRPGVTESPPDIISIQNQHIQNYAKAHGWKIEGKYSDRKNDPNENGGFERMLSDGMQRKFDVVIVDSIFRAGKDLWNAKEVLLQTFTYANIVFVVVEDDFDGTTCTKEEAEAYFTEKYKIYRQDHIRHQCRERNRKGIINWNDLIYGYRFSDDQTEMVIDEKTAPVVKRIFTMYADGKTSGEIAKALTEEKILKPKAMQQTRAKVVDPYIWSTQTINRMLGKSTYAGYWTKTVYGVSCEFTNEPIVSTELFDKVQAILKTNQSKSASRKPVERNRYAGIVCDSRDGFCLHLRTIRSGLKYFAYARNQRGRGGNRHVLLSDVDTAVRNALVTAKNQSTAISEKIRTQGKAYAEQRIARMKESYHTHALLIAEQERERVEAQKKYAEGLITAEDLQKTEERNLALIQKLEKEFLAFPEKVKRVEIAFGDANPWVVLMNTWDPVLPLSREVLNRYVARVELDQLTTITVILRESEWFRELPEEWREQKDGKEEP